MGLTESVFHRRNMEHSFRFACPQALEFFWLTKTAFTLCTSPTHFLCHQHTFYVTNIFSMLPAHFLCHQHTFYLTNTFSMSPTHYICQQHTFYDTNTLYMSATHFLCHQHTFYITNTIIPPSYFSFKLNRILKTEMAPIPSSEESEQIIKSGIKNPQKCENHSRI
jgi:hypothetical protein